MILMKRWLPRSLIHKQLKEDWKYVSITNVNSDEKEEYLEMLRPREKVAGVNFCEDSLEAALELIRRSAV